MKREVASSLVERGVAERVRLAQSYEKRRDELQRQHDAVKAGLSDHKAKVSFFLLLGKRLIIPFLSRGFNDCSLLVSLLLFLTLFCLGCFVIYGATA